MRFTALICWIMFSLLVGALTARADARVALLIGNSSYQNVSSLPNPINDAVDLSASLERLGFAVTVLKDAKYEDMRLALIEFGRRARGADLGVIFFAGHGIQMGGENWLIPIDAQLASDLDVANESIGLQSMIRAVSNAGKLGLVLLDACRNNPFVPKMQLTNISRTVDRGFARVEPSGNVLVAYAARDGTTASDGPGRNSPFTQSLLKNIERPGLEIAFLFRTIRDEVMNSTNQAQQPFLYGSLSSEPIYLRQPNLGTSGTDPDQIVWDIIKDSNGAELFEQFLNRYPDSPFARQARSNLAKITRTDARDKPLESKVDPIAGAAHKRPDDPKIAAISPTAPAPLTSEKRLISFQVEANEEVTLTHQGTGEIASRNWSWKDEPKVSRDSRVRSIDFRAAHLIRIDGNEVSYIWDKKSPSIYEVACGNKAMIAKGDYPPLAGQRITLKCQYDVNQNLIRVNFIVIAGTSADRAILMNESRYKKQNNNFYREDNYVVEFKLFDKSCQLHDFDRNFFSRMLARGGGLTSSNDEVTKQKMRTGSCFLL